MKKTYNEIVKLLKANAIKDDFRNDILRYPKFNNTLKNKAEEYFSLTIKKLGYLTPNSVICSLTDSDSIYFRFYKDTYECHLEVFYDYDNTDEDIEVIASLYENEKLILKQFGKFENIFESIINIVNENKKETKKFKTKNHEKRN